MWFIGVEVEQEISAPPPKKILDLPLRCLEGAVPIDIFAPQYCAYLGAMQYSFIQGQ